MGSSLYEVRDLAKGRIASGLLIGAPVAIAVSAGSWQPWRTLEEAAAEAVAFGGVLGLVSFFQIGRFTVRPIPKEQLPPMRSGLGVLAAEAIVFAILFGFVGGYSAQSLRHHGAIGGWLVGMPIGLAFAQAMELLAWTRIARRERGSLSAPYSVTDTWKSRKRQGVFVVPDSERSRLGSRSVAD